MFSAVEVTGFLLPSLDPGQIPIKVYKQTSMGQVFDRSLRYKHSKLRASWCSRCYSFVFRSFHSIFVFHTHTKRGLKEKRKKYKTAQRMPSL